MNRQFTKQELPEIAQAILSTYNNQTCFAFYAEMGCGKTTLIRTMCELLGVKDAMSSPTFSIINEYQLPSQQKVYHMDWYRLKHVEDAIQAGVQDVLEAPNTICFIEWTEMAEPLLPKQHVKIYIESVSEEERVIRTEAVN
jgi:tRNA threonylcarbamoyladenosine biosynthesis protein TsaE